MARQPIYRVAQERLRDYIREHGLVPGDRLPSEAELASELGVSRPSLREATRSLQTLGVIEAQHGNGLFVAAFSFQPLIDQLPYGLAASTRAVGEILVAREAIEVGLMPAVAQAADHAALDRCGDIAREMIEIEERGGTFVDLDAEFHRALYSGLDNPLVDDLVGVFWRLFGELFHGAGEELPGGAPRDRGRAHLRIVEALQARDADLAMRRMREHFEDLHRRAALIAEHRGT